MKERLDQVLVNRGLAPSREKGKALIMAGSVFVNRQKVAKPGTPVSQEDIIEVKGPQLPYVSRGGLKLKKALSVFGLDLRNKVVLDIGASTGGFTDCALQEGARKVYAVDVGYGQLDWKLRQDQRVISLERKNARYLTVQDIPEPIDLISIDVSFISLNKVLPVLTGFLNKDGFIIALIKPQFEAGREKVGKKGVVRDPLVHRQVINKVWLEAESLGLTAQGLSYSPVTGPEGNIEFLICLRKGTPQEKQYREEMVEKIVAQAHQEL